MEPGWPLGHLLLCSGDRTLLRTLLQPQAAWVRSLRGKVKAEMNACEDVLQVTKRGWSEIKAQVTRLCLELQFLPHPQVSRGNRVTAG